MVEFEYMKEYILDFHTHSRFARGCSKALTLPYIAEWCARKGVDVIATGDFTHPAWFTELSEQLEETEGGLYRVKGLDFSTRFVFGTEISCIYRKHDKTRRMHVLVLAPSRETAGKINEILGKRGNLKSDGRPILGMDAEELAKICLDIDARCLIIPAHIWTPWFSLFGSKSGFDTMHEAFGEMEKYIYAVETGLSSDPKMNWQLKQLNGKTILSNSDAHSAENFAREANVFRMETLSYQNIFDIIRNDDRECFVYTIEFYPEEGKYHYDGHRACGVNLSPEESSKHGKACPKCGLPLTIGVLNRVQELADQKVIAAGRVPARYIVPLQQIIAEVVQTGVKSKRVQMEYKKLTARVPEFTLLLHTPEEDLEKMVFDPLLLDGILRVRSGNIVVIPGYDGVYGVVKVFENAPLRKKQAVLF